MRLDQVISQGCGCSIKAARDRIGGGGVSVNAVVCLEVSSQVFVVADAVAVNGAVAGPPFDARRVFFRLLLMHKARGAVCESAARADSVLHAVPPELAHRHLAPVGRLDKDTTGLLLLTTDGGLSSLLTHPSCCVPKRYTATLSAHRALEADAVQRIAAGIGLADGMVCAPARLELGAEANVVHLTLSEGKNHQVKRMLGACGAAVEQLKRETLGALRLAELTPPLAEGEVRAPTAGEIQLIAASLPAERCRAKRPAKGT